MSLSRGKKIDKNVYDGMCGKVEIWGKEKLNGFFQERLINRKFGFFDAIKKKISQN